MANISSGLAGLSLLTGTDAFAAFSAVAGSLPAIETKAQRKAHAAFTTPETIPLWKQPPSALPVSAQIAGITALKTIIDRQTAADAALPDDIQTVFTTYKALDRLQTLADSAAKDTTGSAGRATLQKAFAKGLADLKAYLATAPSDQVQLSYARSAREARTVTVASPSSLSAATIAGKGVRDTRTGALDGVTGTERLSISLSQGGGATADTVTVDLSTAPQPPTLDGVADAINAAIRAIPRKDAGGAIVRDADGAPVPRWDVSVEPAKQGEKWGLSIKRAGFETISIDQIGGADAVMIASGVTGSDATRPEPTKTQLTRLDDPAGGLTRTTLGSITATDRIATARSTLAADADTTGKVTEQTIVAAVASNAMATDAQGFSYVVGTTAGDSKGNISHGADDLLLTKIDSEGTVVWQRNLGAAGSAQGAAVTIAPDGGIVVAGSVSGSFDGAKSDGDMIVARYDAMGSETFSTLIRAVGVETASAVAVGADGSIYIGGRSDRGSGDAVVTRLDRAGAYKEQRVIAGSGSDSIRALAIGGDGALLALTSESGHAIVRKLKADALATDLGSIDLGIADARAITVAADGRIAVAGATERSLAGAINGAGGGLDGFVAQIDAGLAASRVTYLGTGASDQADSVAFMGSDLYVGGRTAGALSGSRTGDVDAFVARIDAASGAIESVRQYGAIGAKAESVQIAAIRGGNSVLGALGLHRGTLTPTDEVTLEAQTSVRAGDEFSLRVNGGALRKITIDEGETLTTLSDKIRKLVGTAAANVTMPFRDGGRALSITMKPGQEIQFVAGGEGRDALAKLGLDAKRIAAPATTAKGAPTVRPGGAFGLDLDDALQIDTKAGAKIAVSRIKTGGSFAQSAYRSLYWDDTKAALADSSGKTGRTGGSTAIEQAQLANYQAALTRLSGGSAATSYGF